MSRQIGHKWQQGISPQQFREKMTKNQDAFQSWYEKFEWPDGGLEAFFESLNNRDDLRCVILAAEWCGDVVRNVPVVLRAAETAGIPTRILILEEHLDLMDEHLTMGGRSIPVVFIADTGGAILGKWGPRPKYVQEPMVKFKQENPDRDAPDYQDKLAETRAEIKRRYGEDTGYQALILQELQDLLARV
ncbi:thioredoxin family protein [Cohnella sp. CFH 77786]|uniref:thioredoxin family protein n=1 Tax=Cohnella sp. CFH 77786 TaxID=2662265 RepID=UPI001C60EBD2|nr:thioredoxin family protein [Cohnella sp. CFH 77786]MBW5449408.1 thioredoxin family protein [Cohnella sp. CFH 77786]